MSELSGGSYQACAVCGVSVLSGPSNLPVMCEDCAPPSRPPEWGEPQWGELFAMATATRYCCTCPEDHDDRIAHLEGCPAIQAASEILGALRAAMKGESR